MGLVRLLKKTLPKSLITLLIDSLQYEKYTFPHMYTSDELNKATQQLVDACHKNKVILGVFLFGTDRVGEFLEKGFRFVAIGNDLHHVLTQTATHVKTLESLATKVEGGWKRTPTSLF